MRQFLELELQVQPCRGIDQESRIMARSSVWRAEMYCCIGKKENIIQSGQPVPAYIIWVSFQKKKKKKAQ